MLSIEYWRVSFDNNSHAISLDLLAVVIVSISYIKPERDCRE